MNRMDEFCMCSNREHNHAASRKQLFGEATVVGLLMVPLFWAVSRSTTALQFNGPDKVFMDVALSGFLFHVAAEEAGLNAWYLTHSYAANKVLTTHRSNVLYDALDIFRGSGALGWNHSRAS